MTVNSSGMTRGTLKINVGERKVTSCLSGNPNEKRSLEKPGRKYENNNNIYLKNIFIECRQLGSINSLNGSASSYFEHENVMLGLHI